MSAYGNFEREEKSQSLIPSKCFRPLTRLANKQFYLFFRHKTRLPFDANKIFPFGVSSYGNFEIKKKSCTIGSVPVHLGDWPLTGKCNCKCIEDQTGFSQGARK